MMKKFRIAVASLPDRENVVAEIYYNNDQWAEISQEGKEPSIIFFSPSNAKYWEFPLGEALEALQKAKENLLNE